MRGVRTGVHIQQAEAVFQSVHEQWSVREDPHIYNNVYNLALILSQLTLTRRSRFTRARSLGQRDRSFR